MKDDYKKKYENLKKEHERLKEVYETDKEVLVNNIHKLMGLKEDILKNRFLTYGCFMWKLNRDELIYIRKKLMENMGVKNGK